MSNDKAPLPDAVEALRNAMKLTGGRYRGAGFISADKADEVASDLTTLGFTITRQPAMTDAELEREACKLSTYAHTEIEQGELQEAIEDLAKKYRGQA